ncbi:MAG: hypothetical protein IIT58_09905 [Treponema sp.]|nr:hypothetical protein [Treponema sp.]
MKELNLKENVMTEVLSYQEALRSMLVSLNKENPFAKIFEEKFEMIRPITVYMENIQNHLEPVYETVRNLQPILDNVNTISKTIDVPFNQITIPKIRIPVIKIEQESEITPTNDKALFLSPESKQVFYELKNEIHNLKYELRLTKVFLKRIKTEEAKKPIKKYRTGSNEKRTQRELNKCQCYKLYDEIMEKAPNMRVSEIKKTVAHKMHVSPKTIREYLRERL